MMKSEKVKVVDIKDKKSHDDGDIEISEEKVSESTSDNSSESGQEKLDITKLESEDDTPNNTDEESNDSSDNESESNSSNNTEESGSTCEILSKDPLFMVLTEFLMSKNGENICDILDKLNNSIKKLIKDT